MEAKVIFYEGNNGTQNPVKTVLCSDGFDGKFSPNDEARSAILYSVPADYYIAVFDNPDGNFSDDVCEILTKQKTSFSGYIVTSFEKTLEDDYVEQLYESYNGLDGKISYLKMYPASEADKQRIRERIAKKKQQQQEKKTKL